MNRHGLVAASVAGTVVLVLTAPAWAAGHDDPSALAHIAAAQVELSAAAAAITAPAPTVTVTQTVTVTASPSMPTPTPTASSPSPTVTVTAGTVRPVSYWRGLFDNNEASFWSEYQALSKSGDEWDIYDLAYGLDAYRAMWEATGDTRYLDKDLTLVANVIGTARVSSSLSGSQFKDSYLTWPNESTAGGGSIGQEYPLFESYGWRYVTQLLVAMKAAGLTGDPRYQQVLAFTERNIFDKWYTRGTSNLYRNRTHMASHWAFICYDLARLTADATRKARCETVTANIDQAGMALYSGASLRGQLRTLADGGYSWASQWGGTNVQDVDHGNAVLAYTTHVAAVGGYWTGADMAKMAVTLRRISPNKAYVDGTGTDTGWIPDGFVKLGQFDPVTQRFLESWGGTSSQGQFRANMALNARRLTP